MQSTSTRTDMRSRQGFAADRVRLPWIPSLPKTFPKARRKREEAVTLAPCTSLGLDTRTNKYTITPPALVCDICD